MMGIEVIVDIMIEGEVTEGEVVDNIGVGAKVLEGNA